MEGYYLVGCSDQFLLDVNVFVIEKVSPKPTLKLLRAPEFHPPLGDPYSIETRGIEEGNYCI